MNCSQ